MQIQSTFVVDTFAEAFTMRYVRLIVTAADEHWLAAATDALCGYGTSIIACDAEIGVARRLSPDETPDQRVGAAILAFGFQAESLGQAIANRVGQCVMTCVSTAVFDGLAQAASTIPLGQHLRFFGDGFQKSKVIEDRRYWRIPVMDGEFLVEESLGVNKGIAGGNLILQHDDIGQLRQAAKSAVQAARSIPGVILPFPGGVVRSGSKVGSRYRGLKASTSHGFCPTLKGRVETELVDGATAALEIVIDGIDRPSVEAAMRWAMTAAANQGILAISAGNYGGKLGPHHFFLRQILGGDDDDSSADAT